MTINKHQISKQISIKLSISLDDSLNILESFLSLIKISSKSKIIKLSGFGSFKYKRSPKRIGRNPKTKESYIIPTSNKLNFNSSNKIKIILN